MGCCHAATFYGLLIHVNRPLVSGGAELVQAQGILGDKGVYPLTEYCVEGARPALIVFGDYNDSQLTLAATLGLVAAVLVMPTVQEALAGGGFGCR